MMIDAAGRPEPVRDSTMRRYLTGIHHQRSTPFTSSNAYTLMKLLGHESMVTSQPYVTAAGTETATAAA
jgi:hypothetical protein